MTSKSFLARGLALLSLVLPGAIAAEGSSLPKLDVRHTLKRGLHNTLEDGGLAKAGGARSANKDSAARRLAISDNSVLTISTPDGSFRPITLDHSDALFGLPLHGATISAPISAALALSGTSAAAGCKAEDFTAFPSLRGSIFMLQRGNCSFAQKVMNAQQYADARGVIVMDSYYLCGYDTEICDISGGCGGCEYGFEPASPQCLCTLNFMSADPSIAAQITIPAMLITKRDAARVKTLAETGKALIASMSWDLPERNGAAEMTLWGHSQDFYTAQFRESFAPYLPYLLGAGLGSGLEKLPHAIVPRLAFTPKQYLFDGRALGCGIYFDCGSSCINNGRYCSYDAGDDNSAITGSQIVMENLRQMCVWTYLSTKAYPGSLPGVSPSATPSTSPAPSQGASVPPPAPSTSPLPLSVASATLSFWSYVELVTNNCGTKELFSTQYCAESQMQLINVAANGVYPSPSQHPDGPVPSVRPAPGQWTLRSEFLESGIPFMGIDASVVEACMLVSNNSYNATHDQHTWNSLLQPELEAQSELDLYQIPTVIINDIVLRGGVTPKAVMTGLCNSYGLQTALPLVCSCLEVPVEMLQQCVSATAGNNDNGGGTGGNSVVPGDHGKGLPGWAAFLITMVVLGGLGTVATVYYLQRRAARRVEERLNEHYRSLSGPLTDDDRLRLIESVNNNPPGDEQAQPPRGQGRSKVRASSAARAAGSMTGGSVQGSLISRLQQLARVGPHSHIPVGATSNSPYVGNGASPDSSNNAHGAEMRSFHGGGAAQHI